LDTNNNLYLISKYFLNSLKSIEKALRIICCDARTENSDVYLLQQFFRYNAIDALAKHRSVIIGKSTSNQRVERWLGSLRQEDLQWWLSFFKDLRDS
jgi:hypothetical protein